MWILLRAEFARRVYQLLGGDARNPTSERRPGPCPEVCLFAACRPMSRPRVRHRTVGDGRALHAGRGVEPPCTAWPHACRISTLHASPHGQRAWWARTGAMPKPTDKPLMVVIISGATGRTAGAGRQCGAGPVRSPERAGRSSSHNVRTVTAARKIVRELASDHTVICHSLVSPAVRDAVVDEASRRMIPAVDILGRVLAVLSDHLGVAPQRKPGLSYKLQKEYFDRIDAVSFTLEHDDGAGLSTLVRSGCGVGGGVARVQERHLLLPRVSRRASRQRAADPRHRPARPIDGHAPSESDRPDRDSQPPADGARGAASQAGRAARSTTTWAATKSRRTAVCAEGHEEVRLAQHRRFLHGGGRSRRAGAAEHRR